MRAVCMACGEEFEAGKGHLCKSIPPLSFADQLMTAMRPLTRQIDNLCYNNELLEEILTTLSQPYNPFLFHLNLKTCVETWKKQRRE